VFQNLFIEWTTLGESQLPMPVLGVDQRTPPEVRPEVNLGEDDSAVSAPPQQQKSKSAIARLIEHLRSL
jgi:hypothetical protein